MNVWNHGNSLVVAPAKNSQIEAARIFEVVWQRTAVLIRKERCSYTQTCFLAPEVSPSGNPCVQRLRPSFLFLIVWRRRNRTGVFMMN